LIITFIRTIIIFLAIIVSMRLMGKRQLGELEPSELVVTVLISDITSHPLENVGTPLLYGLIPIFTLLCCEILISGATVKSIRFRRFICGAPSIIIDSGRINQEEMRKNRFTVDELMVELRKNGILDIATVKHAILETDGSLSILPYTSEAPVTPKQMALGVREDEYPVIVVSDGRVISENLRVLGKDEKWLDRELRSKGISSPRQVYIMCADCENKVYIAKKEKAR
jgi:uncharacterized membrane protein YcaP (DUF421 family)